MLNRYNSIQSNPTQIYRNISLLATGVSVKASAGFVLHMDISNNAASARFVKLYNKATAPTVGTDTPVITLELPASSCIVFDYSAALQFSLGIGIGATTLVADNNSTAPSANDVVINLMYQ